MEEVREAGMEEILISAIPASTSFRPKVLRSRTLRGICHLLGRQRGKGGELGEKFLRFFVSKMLCCPTQSVRCKKLPLGLARGSTDEILTLNCYINLEENKGLGLTAREQTQV